MKTSLLIIYVLSISCLLFVSSTSFSSNAPIDSLHYYLEHDDLYHYFNAVRETAVSAEEKQDLKAIKEISRVKLTGLRDLNKDEKLMLRKTCMMLGVYWDKYFGDYDSSKYFLMIAHQNVSDTIFLDVNVWYIENRLGIIYTQDGDYEKANHFYSLTERSLLHFQQNDRLSRLYTNLGQQYYSQLQNEKAVYYWQKGLLIADSLGYDNGIFSNHLHLAELYTKLGQFKPSFDHLEAAGQALDSLHQDSRLMEKFSGWLEAKGNLEKAKGNLPGSLNYFQQAICEAISFYENVPRRELAKTYTQLTEIYFKLDSVNQEEAFINKGLNALVPELPSSGRLLKPNEIYAENSFIPLLVNQSNLLAKEAAASKQLDLFDSALYCIRLALDVSDQIRNPVTMDASKLVSLQDHKLIINQGVEVAYAGYEHGDHEKYFNEARQLFSRSKGLLYNDKRKRSFIIEKLEASDRHELDSLEKNTLDLIDLKYDASANLDSINGQILKAREKIFQIFHPYDVLNTRQTLKGDYIEYCVTPGHVFALSDINGKKIFLQLGTTRQIDSLLLSFQQFINQKGEGKDDGILGQLDKFLIQPICQKLPKSIVIIPDGTLGKIPFEMLKDEQQHYLIENSDITYAFQFESYLPEKSSSKSRNEIFCLAPAYVKGSTEIALRSGEKLEALPFAQNEVESIEKIFGQSLHTTESGTKENYLNEIRNSKIFHFSGHAVKKEDHAYLVLNNEADEKDQLTDTEIGLMHLPLDLVVLSACQTGLGKLEPGEGIRSLGRSFMEAGASASVFSLWNVNDRSTASFMTSFYKYLKDGKRKDEALRQTKLDFIRQGAEGYGHPYHWAAFVGVGDMGSIHQRLSISLMVIALLILIPVLVLIFIKAK